MIIIVDTNFLFALKAKKDKNRDKAIKILKDFNDKNHELITSYFLHMISSYASYDSEILPPIAI